MLEHIRPEEVLFIDIETVPQVSGFNQLDYEFKELWTEKSRFIREKQNIDLNESYHQAGIYAEFGKIICISAGYFSTHTGERVLRITSFYDSDENVLLNNFAGLLNQYDKNPFRVLCAHNGKEFDFPYICRRMLVNKVPLPSMLNLAGKKPWEIPHIDTMEQWKFGDHKHYTSLKLLAQIFGIPTPKDDIDGSMVRSVYYENQDIDRIKHYCQKDVATVAQIFLRYRGDKPLEENQIIGIS